MTLPGLIIGFLQSPLAVGTGSASLVLGFVEGVQENYIAAAIASVGGMGLLAIVWIVKSLTRVGERAVDKWFTDLVDLPAEVQATGAKVKTLTETLENFAYEWKRDREQSDQFRVVLATTLENHTVRIKGVEDRFPPTSTWPPRQ